MMISIFFGTETADRGLAKVRWARDNGVPIVYAYTSADQRYYRGSRWMTRFYVPRRDAMGRPGYAGGHLLIRERDRTLWTLRWGAFSDDPHTATSF